MVSGLEYGCKPDFSSAFQNCSAISDGDFADSCRVTTRDIPVFGLGLSTCDMSTLESGMQSRGTKVFFLEYMRYTYANHIL